VRQNTENKQVIEIREKLSICLTVRLWDAP
jgi:hypothetical protein